MGIIGCDYGENCCNKERLSIKESRKTKDTPDSLINFYIDTEIFVRKSSCNLKDVYEKLEPLGEGGFGSVYKVKLIKTREIRAMKQMSKDHLLESNDPDAYKNEIDVLKKLDHPNIMKIYEFFEDEDNIYIINEFCNNGDLLEKLEKYETFSEFLVKYIMYQVFLAVNYLHNSKVLHGDIKLQNILCDREKNDKENKSNDAFNIITKDEKLQKELQDAENIDDLSQEAKFFLSELRKYDFKLVDFGSAKIKKKTEENEVSQGIFGTIYYCSPEAQKGIQNFIYDEWSCGILMYILLTGFPPFDGKTIDDITEKILHEEPDLNVTELINVSQPCKDLIKQLLNKDPDQRIKVDKALKSEFFTKGIKISELLKGTTDKKSAFDNLMKKKAKYKSLREKTKTSKFREAVIAYIAKYFAKKEKESEIKEIFREMTNNNPNFLISKETFINTLKEKSGEKNTKFLSDLFESIDDNKNGIIDYEELVRSLCNEEDILTEKNVENAFNFFDYDHSGEITWDEIASVIFKGKTEEISKQTMKELFKEIGEENKNKGIDLETFKKMFVVKKK